MHVLNDCIPECFDFYGFACFYQVKVKMQVRDAQNEAYVRRKIVFTGIKTCESGDSLCDNLKTGVIRDSASVFVVKHKIFGDFCLAFDNPFISFCVCYSVDYEHLAPVRNES